MLIDKKTPTIDNDVKVSLIYIGDFIEEIVKILDSDKNVNLNKRLIN